MAKDTAKKNLRSNKSRLALFRGITVVINIVYLLSLVVSVGLEGISVGSLFAVVFWAVQEYAALALLAARGSGEYNESGELQDCVDIADPQQLGIYSYAQDLLWVCWAVHLLTSWSSWCFFLYLPVPVVALYKSWSYVLGPLLSRFLQSSSSQQQQGDLQPADDPRSRLQRRREELRARKGKTSKQS